MAPVLVRTGSDLLNGRKKRIPVEATEQNRLSGKQELPVCWYRLGPHKTLICSRKPNPAAGTNFHCVYQLWTRPRTISCLFRTDPSRNQLTGPVQLRARTSRFVFPPHLWLVHGLISSGNARSRTTQLQEVKRRTDLQDPGPVSGSGHCRITDPRVDGCFRGLRVSSAGDTRRAQKSRPL